MASPRQKNAVVTGCSKGGLGDAMARELHNQGYRVFATIRDEAKAAHLKELGIDDLVLMDVTDAETICSAAEKVKEATGGVLDVLINNAGAGYSTSIADADIAKAKQLFDVNYFGVIAVTQAFTPLLIASGDARILNIGSILGEIYRPFTGIYNSAKAALAMTSETMRVELAPFGIKVIHVVTGGISTNLIATGNQMSFPETSLYTPIREQATPYVDGSTIQSVMTTPADEYARVVIANALKPAPNVYFWYGAESRLVWLVSTFFPRSWLDNRYAKSMGFARLAEILGVVGSKPKDI